MSSPQTLCPVPWRTHLISNETLWGVSLEQASKTHWHFSIEVWFSEYLLLRKPCGIGKPFDSTFDQKGMRWYDQVIAQKLPLNDHGKTYWLGDHLLAYLHGAKSIDYYRLVVKQQMGAKQHVLRYVKTIWATKTLVVGCMKGIILPGCWLYVIRIVVSHYKNPYEPISNVMSWLFRKLLISESGALERGALRDLGCGLPVQVEGHRQGAASNQGGSIDFLWPIWRDLQNLQLSFNFLRLHCST